MFMYINFTTLCNPKTLTGMTTILCLLETIDQLDNVAFAYSYDVCVCDLVATNEDNFTSFISIDYLVVQWMSFGLSGIL